MKYFIIITIICSTILLQGCSNTAIIGSSVVIIKSAIDPRSIGRQIDDKILELRVSSAINKDKIIINNSRIITTAYQGKILLTGQVYNLILAERAKKIANKINGVESVYNEIRQEIPVNLGTAFKDILITTKIKLHFFIKNLVKSLHIKVITENGEVFLLGLITKHEGNIITKIANNTYDVKRVITIFTYLN
ncbi:MAG: division/outer membrane stress-associated lipid-binding lipoprotein [Arsenophonus endosymbiont of Ceratovacuna japonica]